jgi:hypothetical protein
MSEHEHAESDSGTNIHGNEGTQPPSMKDLAHQIAVLMVRQHRRLKARDSEKGGENA